VVVMYDHGESIYNIIPPEELETQRPPKHHSRHNPQLPPTGTTFGHAQSSHPLVTNMAGDSEGKAVPDKSCRTMGRAPGSNQTSPTNYMKKGARSKKVESLHELRNSSPEKLSPSSMKTKRRPDVPRKDDAPVHSLETTKNFVVANAVEVILAAPKRVSQGTKDYLHKEDYGKVPKYLKQIQADIEDESEYIRQLKVMERQSDNQARELSEPERQKLVDGLKAKWELVNTEYQATTHITDLDTQGKVKRKAKWEAELTQIEKDIEKLSRKTILVQG